MWKANLTARTCSKRRIRDGAQHGNLLRQSVPLRLHRRQLLRELRHQLVFLQRHDNGVGRAKHSVDAQASLALQHSADTYQLKTKSNPMP